MKNQINNTKARYSRRQLDKKFIVSAPLEHFPEDGKNIPEVNAGWVTLSVHDTHEQALSALKQVKGY